MRPQTPTTSPVAHLLDTRAAARYLGIAHGTLQNARSRGDGPAYVRVGRRSIRYRVCDLELYIQARISA